MKKLLAGCLGVWLLLGLFPGSFGTRASARAATAGAYVYTIAGGKATITGYTGAGGEVVIPGTLGGQPVTNIGYHAFGRLTTPTHVTLGSSVTNLDDFAFAGCSALTSVTLGSGVTIIGKQAFASCTGLPSVTLPANVTTIGYGAFAGCSGLTSVTIGNGVTSIDGIAFYGCEGLTAAYFSGNAPTGTYDIFDACATDFKVHYVSGTTGWANPWFGYPTVVGNGATKHQPEIKEEQKNYSFPLVLLFSIFLVISLLVLSFGKNKWKRSKQ